MKSTRFMIIFTICFLFSGCSFTTITYDYDRDFDFSNLKQYNWMEISADFPANDIVVQRIIKAVDQQMELKGFSESVESPDFLISLQGFRDIIREGIERGTAYRGYRGYDRTYERRLDVYEYEEGTLTVTIINAAGNNLIWQGSATATLEPNLSPETRDERTQKAVTKLLADFPPIPKN